MNRFGTVLAPWLSRWQSIAPRDRWALSILAGFIGLLLAYWLVWRPVTQELEAAQQFLAQQRSLNAYMHTHAPTLRARQGQASQTLPAQELQGLLTSTAAAGKLHIERLQRQGDQAWQVNLQPLAFAQLLTWLQQLQEQGVRISEAAIEREAGAKVRARLLLSVSP